MKAKSGFIVNKNPNEGELFGSIVVITPGVLSKDIRKEYEKAYPDNPIKSKLFDQMAEEMTRYLNGTSMPEDMYNQNVQKGANVLNTYTTISLMKFSNMVDAARNYAAAGGTAKE